jgi:hypothetical protein
LRDHHCLRGWSISVDRFAVAKPAAAVEGDKFPQTPEEIRQSTGSLREFRGGELCAILDAQPAPEG